MIEYIDNNILYSAGYAFAGFIFLVLISFVYIYKQRTKSLSSMSFRHLLIVSMILCLSEIVYCVTAKYTSIFGNLYLITARIETFFLIVDTISLVTYFIIKVKEFKINKNVNTKEISKKGIFIIYAIAIIIALTLFIASLFYEMHYTTNNMYVLNGGSFNMIGFTDLFAIIAVMIYFISNKYVEKNYKIINSVMIIAFIIILSFSFINNNFDFNYTVFAYAICTLTIYFTMESEDGKLIKDLSARKEERENSENSKMNFLSNMSHEIRTPLSGILGYSEIILTGNDSDEDKLKYTKNIYTDGLSLKELIENMMDISKIEAEKIDVVNENYNIEDLKNELLDTFESRTKLKGLEFSVDITENVPSVLNGDKRYVVKVLELIIINAIKYTDLGKIEITIDANPYEDGFMLKMTVHNSGHTMPASEFAKEFENYAKVLNDDITKVDTITLGVGIAKKIVDMMGGTIDFRNESGHGTEYYINIKQFNRKE